VIFRSASTHHIFQLDNNNNQADVGILGAGIMGCCLALELAQRGYKVDLVDRAFAPMTGASLHNEGKLHLGFVYAKDPLKATHRLMARGSLSFSRIIENLTGSQPDALRPSQPFHYYVPTSSQLDMDTIHQHFHDVEGAIREESQISADTYLGRKVDRYFEHNSFEYHKSIFSPENTLGSFTTEELSISPAAVANILCQAIKQQPNITFIGGTEVLAAHRLASGNVEIKLCQDYETSKTVYPCVVNCLWEGKLRIDETAGIHDQGSWILRYKATINISAPRTARNGIPSATGILGRYGDVVNHNNGAYYISWYPLCKIAETIHGDGRDIQDMVHKGAASHQIKKAISNYRSISKFVASITHKKFITDNILETAAYIPSIVSLLNSTSRHCEVGGGIILARGKTDIDDPESHLHQRSEIGPVAYGSYVTIDTGKYCMAPLFAEETANMIANIL
jgi:hypothetical protein